MSSERSVPRSDTEAPPQLSQVSETAPPGVFPVVVVGAGDVQTLQQFFAALPPGEDLAFLVLSSPGAVAGADLVALLAASARLPVCAADDAVHLAPNTVVVVPPAATIAATDDPYVLSLAPRDGAANLDAAFRSLAQVLGPRAIGVLLDGAGPDGMLGLAEVRRLGGLAAIQSMHEWGTAAIPASALTMTPADIALPLSELARQVRQYAHAFAQHAGAHGAGMPAGTTGAVAEAVARVSRGIYQHINQDFGIYQTAYLLGAISRRQLLLGFGSLEEYARYVEQEAKESYLLQRDLLAGSHEFFRAPEGIAALVDHVIPSIFYGKNASSQVRVWVVGCATGEEAYSVAMLLQEYMEQLTDPPELRIFATDGSLDSLRIAREGVFAESAAAEIDPTRLRRFFVRDGRWLRINQAVRKQMIFAQHNPLKDPPFPKLDLVVSRDLLAVLNPEAKVQLARLWHIALKPDGYLIVGEHDAPHSSLFAPLEPAVPVYMRLAVPAPGEVPPPSATARRDVQPAELEYREHAFAGLFAEQIRQYVPPGLLVDQHYDIVYYSDAISPYLVQPGGAATDSVLQRIHPDLREPVAAAVMAAFKQATATHTAPLAFGHAMERRRVRIIVRPLAGTGAQRLALVLFQPDAPAAPDAQALPDTQAVPDAESDSRVRSLQHSMAELQQQLHQVTDEYTTINEELRAANEELQSLNEELQLKTYELQRGKEELMTANQELMLVNRENQDNIAELRRISANLQNLISASDIATLFLNNDLAIRWFTPGMAELLNLLPGDEGRPLWHITHRMLDGDLERHVRTVLATMEPYATEVGSEAGRWYVMRVLPYRAADGKIDGVVITFVDITARKHAEDALRLLNLQLEQRVEERTQELARSNRELDQFAYVASHDLKAPLRAVTNLANWISEDAAQVLPATSQEHLAKLRSRIVRMEHLLDDLLAYSRAGRHLHEPEWVDTAEMVRSIQYFLALPTGFSLQLEHPMPQLFTERVPLETVLRNLVANAVKHHDRPYEGFVRVSTEEIDGWVQFSVTDNGPGIAPQHHERIFQIFQTLKPRDQVEGSGMGLAVVKKTVESQGGRIELISDVGQGAVFRFTWPKLPDDHAENGTEDRTNSHIDYRPNDHTQV